jgi:proteasome lid subunit RPN8/RPN11
MKDPSTGCDVALRSAVWRAVAERCRVAWPLEACGLVIDGELAATETAPASDAHFRLAPRDALLLERALRRGASVVLWHSHTTAAAPEGMSGADVGGAAPRGEPLHPGVVHAVLDLRTGPAATGVRGFAWNGVGFEPVPVPGS